ncbi:hypothetical protein BOTBODRAFT_530623 [Botryobasidium botryosum FD-172 SS1]|uniref:Uncharacterized protein n=1 Tax=Botryobasidium botryosum (strain FD-172 SS1) TaxID=930990 RepID=A0A067M105_BOTB1|nr:hypothetical protein BOTBODRAFT_530623 [Botryobasidium botryosum FD-172 SS1]
MLLLSAYPSFNFNASDVYCVFIATTYLFNLLLPRVSSLPFSHLTPLRTSPPPYFPSPSCLLCHTNTLVDIPPTATRSFISFICHHQSYIYSPSYFSAPLAAFGILSESSPLSLLSLFLFFRYADSGLYSTHGLYTCSVVFSPILLFSFPFSSHLYCLLPTFPSTL